MTSRAADAPQRGGIRVGGYVLSPGDPGGSVASAGEGVEEVELAALREALAEWSPSPEEEEEPAPTGPATAVAGAFDDASAVTAEVERASRIGQRAAEGIAFDPDQLHDLADPLLKLFERLDHEGRCEEALKAARALTTLYSLLKRWAALVQTLRSALVAAKKFGSLEDIGWVENELGALRIATEDITGAERSLRRALECRQAGGDRGALAATERNLQTHCGQMRQLVRERKLVPRRGRRLPRRQLVLAAAAAGVLALGAATGAALGSGLMDDDTVAPTLISDGTTLPTTTNGTDPTMPTEPTTTTGDPTRTTDPTSTDEPTETTDPTDPTETTKPVEMRRLTLIADGRGTIRGPGFKCREDTCTEDYSIGKEIALQVMPSAGYGLLEFGGDCEGKECTVEMNDDHTVTATFVELESLEAIERELEGESP